MEDRPATGAPRLTAIALLFASGAAFGLAPSLARTAVTGGIPPMGYVFWMTTGAALLGLFVARLRGQWPRFSRPFLLYYVSSGATRIVFGGFVMYTALVHVPAGVVSIVIATAPLMTYFVRLLIGQEHLIGPRALGILLGLILTDLEEVHRSGRAHV